MKKNGRGEEGYVFRKGRVHVKPSKPASVMGIVVGIAFIILGITQVIPMAGIFGVVWTLIAVAITGFNAYNLISAKGSGYYQIDLDDSREPSARNDFAERLRKVEQLYKDGLITEEEYRQKREDILREKW
jgi:hypothetical protein